jgi:hypothetical protein
MRYHFHVFNGFRVILDPDGGDFPNLAAAAAEGAQSARDLIAEKLRAGKPFPKGWVVQIADPDGIVLEVIPFDELLTTEVDHLPKPRIEAERSSLQSSSHDSDFPALYARAKASAERSRSLNEEIKATVGDIRERLRTLADFKLG